MTSTLLAPDEHISPVRPPRENGYAAVYTLRRGRGDTPRTLTEARTSMGLTMTDLARLLHVSRPTVSGWEKGLRRPARYRWGGLAAVLKLTEAQVGTLFADHPPARLDGVPLPSLASERRRRGLTQQKVAELVRVAPTTLSMWETAEIPVSPAMAALLAEVLDTDEAALLAAPIPD
jgi:transcriptional regulator with XRE-family HTH domain